MGGDDTVVDNFSVTVMVTVFVVTLTMVKLAMMVVKKKRYNLPPGPWGLPLVGYLPFLGPEPHVTFKGLRKNYGDVIGLYMGSFYTVVVSGSDAIKEALVTKKDDFAGRPDLTANRLSNNFRALENLTYGPLWKLHHKIVRNVLYTSINARKGTIESIVRSEANTVVEEFLSHGNKSFCPLPQLDVAAFSMIYQFCYARNKDVREDKDFMPFLTYTRAFEMFNAAGNVVNVMPWLRHIMPGKVSHFLEMLQESEKLGGEKVAEHESSFDRNNLRDITDCLILAGNQLTEEEKALGTNKNRLAQFLPTLFGAGSATISATLRWCVAMMVAFPEVQEDVFQQINRVVGQGRYITLADRNQLPLVEATVNEVFRYIGVIPFALPHSTTCDTTLQGYDIPEGTVVMVNLYSVFKDEKLWGDPQVFRPHRFLDSEGQLDRGLVEQVPTFSLGRRRCVGEQLARMELFLFFATLMQRLQFCRPAGQRDFTLKAGFTLAIDVLPFEMCVRPRK